MVGPSWEEGVTVFHPFQCPHRGCLIHIFTAEQKWTKEDRKNILKWLMSKGLLWPETSPQHRHHSAGSHVHSSIHWGHSWPSSSSTSVRKEFRAGECLLRIYVYMSKTSLITIPMTHDVCEEIRSLEETLVRLCQNYKLLFLKDWFSTTGFSVGFKNGSILY